MFPAGSVGARPALLVLTVIAALATVCLVLDSGPKHAASKGLIRKAASDIIGVASTLPHKRQPMLRASVQPKDGEEAVLKDARPALVFDGAEGGEAVLADAEPVPVSDGEALLQAPQLVEPHAPSASRAQGHQGLSDGNDLDSDGNGGAGDDAKFGGGGSVAGRVLVQLLWAIVYYYTIANKYPMLADTPPTDAARALQEKGALSAISDSSFATCFHSYCCSGPRAAHTFQSVGVMDFVPAAILMSLFPCCTLFYMNSCTELNVKLGGTQQGICAAACCSFFCSCCLIAQDAETLDLITGAKTGFCDVEPPPAATNLMHAAQHAGQAVAHAILGDR